MYNVAVFIQYEYTFSGFSREIFSQSGNRFCEYSAHGVKSPNRKNNINTSALPDAGNSPRFPAVIFPPGFLGIITSACLINHIVRLMRRVEHLYDGVRQKNRAGIQGCSYAAIT
jgi:hypothetical protein